MICLGQANTNKIVLFLSHLASKLEMLHVMLKLILTQSALELMITPHLRLEAQDPNTPWEIKLSRKLEMIVQDQELMSHFWIKLEPAHPQSNLKEDCMICLLTIFLVQVPTTKT